MQNIIRMNKRILRAVGAQTIRQCLRTVLCVFNVILAGDAKAEGLQVLYSFSTVTMGQGVDNKEVKWLQVGFT